MKIIFVNPPHVRSENSSPENNFAIKGFVFKSNFSKVPGLSRLFNWLNKIFGLGKGVRYGVRAGSRWPFTLDMPMTYAPYPFFMGYAAGYLQKHGFDVDMIDSIAEAEYSYDNFFAMLESCRPDIVVVECSTPTIDIDLWVAKRTARFAEVALAGPHLTDATVRDIQRANKEIKYFLKGEYILSSLGMANSRRPGVYESEVVTDLDQIPFPFRDYPAATAYFDPSMPTSRPQLQIYSSKGCPFKCTFCVWPQVMYKGKVSLRSPEKIAEEIRQAVDLQGYKSIFFDDDTFNMGTKRISELCDYLKDIGLPWTMMGRLDCSPDWLYDKMVESHCVGMRFGIETFNLEVLKNVKKGIERVDFREILKHIAITYPNIMIHLTMMKDMPGQTEEIHQNDMRILHGLGFSTTNIQRSYQLSHCSPFPGTEMYRELVEKHGEDKLNDYSKYDGSKDTVMVDMRSS